MRLWGGGNDWKGFGVFEEVKDGVGVGVGAKVGVGAVACCFADTVRAGMSAGSDCRLRVLVAADAAPAAVAVDVVVDVVDVVVVVVVVVVAINWSSNMDEQ